MTKKLLAVLSAFIILIVFAPTVSAHDGWRSGRSNRRVINRFRAEGRTFMRYYDGYYYGYGRSHRRRGCNYFGIAGRIAIPFIAHRVGEERGRREGFQEGYEAAILEAEAYERRRELDRRAQAPRISFNQEKSYDERVQSSHQSDDLIPMTNNSAFVAIVYDGNVEVARLRPAELKYLPEPQAGYRAVLRTVVGNRIHYEPVDVSHNESHSGWEINEPEKE